MLLIRSSKGTPEWLSPLESVKLAVGYSKFTCCEQNHQGDFQHCDRKLVGKWIDNMVSSKVQYLFEQDKYVSARLTFVQRQWYVLSHLSPVFLGTHSYIYQPQVFEGTSSKREYQITG